MLIPCAFFGGGVTVSAGVALISLPAGLIVAGVGMIGGACLYELNGAGEDDQ